MLLLENARVCAADFRSARLGALLISGRFIEQVFDAPFPEIRQPGVEIHRVDVRGRTLVPSFTDSHIHLLDWGFSLGRVDLNAARSIEDVVSMTAQHAREHPLAPGQWVIGQGWACNLWPNPALPDSTKPLDAAFPDRPVFLSSKCGHLSWANAAALRAANLDASTPNPPGGEIARNPRTGELTGILKENAIGLVDRVVPPPGPAEWRLALERATAAAHRQGLTAVHAVEGAVAYRTFDQARSESALDLRVTFYYPVGAIDGAIELFNAAKKNARPDDIYTKRLNLVGVKLFTDGSLGGRTAWMLEPLEGEPDNKGLPVLSGKPLRELIRKANSNGMSCAIHAIGDAAIRDTLGAYKEVWDGLAGNPVRAQLRNRIEHFQTVHPDDLGVLAHVPLSACMQPVHLFADWRAADRWLGKRAPWTYALRSIQSAGARLAFGSDAPVETINVMQGIYAACCRKDLEGQPAAGWNMQEGVERWEALRAYCLAGHEISGAAGHIGVIAPGQIADLAVIESDPLTAPEAQLPNLRVFGTMLDGKWVYSSEEIEVK